MPATLGGDFTPVDNPRRRTDPNSLCLCLQSPPPPSFHNSFPTACKRVSAIAKRELGANASEEDKKALDIEVYRGDITVKEDIEKIFKDYESKGGIYGVIHVAALKAVGESGEIPIQYYNVNIAATVHLLDVGSFRAWCLLFRQC